MKGARLRDRPTCSDEPFLDPCSLDGANDFVKAVRTLIELTDRPIRWVGMDPMSSLARLVEEAPDLVERLVATQMGFAID